MSDYDSDPLENPLAHMTMEPYVHDPLRKFSGRPTADNNGSEIEKELSGGDTNSNSGSDDDHQTLHVDARTDNLAWYVLSISKKLVDTIRYV